MEEKLVKDKEEVREKVYKKKLLKGLKKKFKKEKQAYKGTKIKLRKGRYELFLRIAIFLIFIGIIGLGIFFFIILSRESETSDTISLSSIFLPETGEAEGKQVEYYSPTFDLIFPYDLDKFYVSEGAGQVNIEPRYFESVSVGLDVNDISIGEDPTGYFSANYVEAYPDTEVTRNEKSDDGFWNLDLNYSKDLNIKQEASQKVFHSILIREIDASYITLDVYSNKFSIFPQELLDDLKGIVYTVEHAPTDLEQEASISIGNISLAYDRDKWSVSLLAEKEVELAFRSGEYELEEELKQNSTSFNMYAQNMGENKVDEDYILNLLDEEITRDESIYSDLEFTVLTQQQQKQIADVLFYYTNYSYVLFERNYIITKYFGYLDEADLLVSITVSEENTQSEGSKEVEKLFDNINLDQEEISAEALTQKFEQSVLGESTFEIQKSTVLGKPAVHYVFNRTCVEASFAKDSLFYYAAGNTYELCSAGYGSAFSVNKDGYLVTNAHVASLDPLDVAITGTIIGHDPDGLFTDLRRDLMEYLKTESPDDYEDLLLDPYDESSQEYVENMIIAGLVYEYLDGYVDLTEISNVNYVQKDEPFDFDKYSYDLTNKSSHLKLELLDHREIESVYEIYVQKYIDEEETGFAVPDLAVLKVEKQTQEYPSIRLSTLEKILVGAPIQVIGFPGSANDEDVFSREASLVPTITTGTISAIKPSFQNAYDLIQIDASISYGNSGGPIINTDGEVVGVATYGLSMEESADFNAGVSVEEVQNILSENNISNDVGETISHIEDALEYYSLNYYKWAIRDLNEAKGLSQKVGDVVDPIITNAQEKLDEGQDNTPVLTFGDIYIHKNELLIVVAITSTLICGVALIILLIIVRIIYKGLKRRKEKKQAKKKEEPSQPPAVPEKVKQSAGPANIGKESKDGVNEDNKVKIDPTKIEETPKEVSKEDNEKPPLTDKPSEIDVEKSAHEGLVPDGRTVSERQRAYKVKDDFKEVVEELEKRQGEEIQKQQSVPSANKPKEPDSPAVPSAQTTKPDSAQTSDSTPVSTTAPDSTSTPTPTPTSPTSSPSMPGSIPDSTSTPTLTSAPTPTPPSTSSPPPSVSLTGKEEK